MGKKTYHNCIYNVIRIIFEGFNSFRSAHVGLLHYQLNVLGLHFGVAYLYTKNDLMSLYDLRQLTHKFELAEVVRSQTTQ